MKDAFRLGAVVLALMLLGACGHGPEETPAATTLFADQSQTLADVRPTPTADGVASNAKSRLTAAQADRLAQMLNEIPLVDFDLPTLDGGNVKAGDFKGKVLVVNLMATWCKFCIEEMPMLSEAGKLFEGEDVVFLEISTFETGFQDKVKKDLETLMASYKIPFQVALDWSGELGMILSPRGSIPVTLVVDREGVVRFYYPGALQSVQDLVELIDFTLYHLDRYVAE